jgi:hypothetical protein
MNIKYYLWPVAEIHLKQRLFKKVTVHGSK